MFELKKKIFRDLAQRSFRSFFLCLIFRVESKSNRRKTLNAVSNFFLFVSRVVLEKKINVRSRLTRSN